MFVIQLTWNPPTVPSHCSRCVENNEGFHLISCPPQVEVFALAKNVSPLHRTVSYNLVYLG